MSNVTFGHYLFTIIKIQLRLCHIQIWVNTLITNSVYNSIFDFLDQKKLWKKMCYGFFSDFHDEHILPQNLTFFYFLYIKSLFSNPMLDFVQLKYVIQRLRTHPQDEKTDYMYHKVAQWLYKIGLFFRSPLMRDWN